MGGIAAGLGGLARGFTEGVKLRSDLDDAEQRRTLAAEQNTRDQKRFTLEEERMAEEKRKIAAHQEHQQTLQQINDDAANGRNGFEQFGHKAPPQQAQTAILGPDGHGTPVQQKAPNPFIPAGDGLYENQAGADKLVNERKAAAMEKLFTVNNEPEKAMMVREQAAKLLESNAERKMKRELLAAATGVPGAIGALSSVYGYLNDGMQINPKSGQWDAATKTWKGVEFINSKTGEKGVRDLDQGSLIGMAKQDLTAMIAFNVDQQWKERSAKVEERKAGAAETSAQGTLLSGQAAKQRAVTQESAAGADAKGQQQLATVKAISSIFPLVNKEYKIEDFAGKKPAEKQVMMDRQEADRRMATDTLNLHGLNPKVDVSTLAALVRSGQVKKEVDANGRPFTMSGSTKVWLSQ